MAGKLVEEQKSSNTFLKLLLVAAGALLILIGIVNHMIQQRNSEIGISGNDTPVSIVREVVPAGTNTPTELDGHQLVTTASGLKYYDIVEGHGDSPTQSARVTMHYTGWLLNNKKFDSSLDRGVPFQFMFGAGQVIKGFDEGVSTMKVGGKRKLLIPPELGYGSREIPNTIPANSTLIFEVQLLGVETPQQG